MNYSTTNKRAMAVLVTAITIMLTLTRPASALMVSQFNGLQAGTDLTFTPPPLPPPPPESVPLAPILWSRWKTKDKVMLDYLDVSLVETGFDLEVRRAGGPWQLIDTLDPLGGKFVSGSYPVTGLEPSTDYCFRLIAFNAAGDSPPNEICTRTTYAERLSPAGVAHEACDEATLEDVVEPATDENGYEVEINCDLYLEPAPMVFKRLLFTGSAASGLMVDLGGATLAGGEGAPNGGRDMIEVRSAEVVVQDVDNAISTYERPSDITIRNGQIIGSIRLWGMATNGEGDGPKDCGTYYSGDCEVAKNQLKKSSRLFGHTARAQSNAPTRIVLERLTITATGRTPVYFAPGVTNSQLINSHVLGYSNAVAIYLDAESAGNTFKGNVIDVATKNYPFEQWDRPLVAIDGSARNRFFDNWFSSLNHGGIYFYRNCGENGVIRHQMPQQNQLINNIFYYNKYDGDNPAVFLGSRNRGGWVQDNFGFCEDDAGYPYGSSVMDEDFARYNAIMQNQIYVRSVSDMIQRNNPGINDPNYIVGNVTVTEATVNKTRLAGCYDGSAGFLWHGQSFTRSTDPTGCRGITYICQDGEIVERPFNHCFSVKTTSTLTLSPLR